MSEKKLKILIVGATGTLGRAIEAELSPRHTVLIASRTSKDFALDITDTQSVHSTFLKIGKVDAVICATGEVAFVPLAEMKAEALGASAFTLGITNKLMGQINLALAAREFIHDGGSITLTSGILCEHPIAKGASASMVNGALEAFVRAAAIELPRSLRINIVSPNVLQESMESFAPFFRGFEAIPAARAALAYSRSVEGLQTGQVYKVF